MGVVWEYKRMIPAVTGAVGTSNILPYYWVAVGGSTAGSRSMISYSSSTTGAAGTWTVLDNTTTSFSTTGINSVASNGQKLIAVGDTGKMAVSENVTTWTQITSSFSTTNINWVTYGNGWWVAVGDSGKIATSTDGATWTQGTAVGANAITQVGYGNGRWALINDLGTIYSTAAGDPTATWTSRTSTLGANAKNVGYSTQASIWIGSNDSGTTGALASSTDSVTWTARTSPTSLGSTYFGKVTNNATVTALRLSSVVILYSTNGTTWTASASTPAGNNRCIAVDQSNNFLRLDQSTTTGTAYSSTDANTWTSQGTMTFVTNGYPAAMCHTSLAPEAR